MWKRLTNLIRVIKGREQFEANMTEELRFHIDQYAADLMKTGMTQQQATRQAKIELGHPHEDCRQSRGIHLIEEGNRQLRYAARMLRKSPGFTATALLTLTICLGANLTIFAVIDSVLLRPLPFPHPDRLVHIFNTYPKAGVDRDGSSLTNYYERRGQINALASIALHRPGTAIVGEPGATEREQITRITPDFFATLETGPAIGRTFPEETDNVAILTDAYWRQNFQADPAIIGRQIRIDGTAKTVIGVLPPDFRFLSSEARIYLPLTSRPQDRMPSNRHSGGNATHMIARLNAGQTIATAQAQIDAHNAAVETGSAQGARMADAGFRTLVLGLHDDHVANIRGMLILLQTGVLVLLIIGVVNLVNLLLVRATGRTKELALRQALGASRGHVLSEVLVETGLLTFTGTVLGMAAAAAGTRLLSVRLPIEATIAFDARTGLVALAFSLLIGLALGLPIAWFNTRGNLGTAIQSENRGGTAGHAVQQLRHVFLVAQFALAFVLLAGAGLLALSLKEAMAVNPGFRPENILTGQITVPWRTREAFTNQLTEALNNQPGVIAAGLITNIPFSGNEGKSAATVKGHVLKANESPRGHYSYGVAGDYFNAIGVTLLAGRFLTANDNRSCVVDEDFARHYWPGETAIGRQLWMGYRPNASDRKDEEAFTVVGVIGRVKQAGLTDDGTQGAVYYTYMHRPDGTVYAAIRTRESFALTLQKLVRQLTPDLPVTDIRTMETRIETSLATRRLPALLAGLFSAIALLLTAIGVYGVLSYAVTRQRREIGVRIALGARPQQIRAQFLTQALRLLAAGTAIGLAGAWLTGKAMETILFRVPAFNPATLTAAAAILGAVALTACLLPSHRAAKISPLEALSTD